MNPNEQPSTQQSPTPVQAATPTQPITPPAEIFTQPSPSQPTYPPVQGSGMGTMLTHKKSKLPFYIAAGVVLIALVLFGFLLLHKKDSKPNDTSTKSAATSPDASGSSSNTSYIDSANGFSFDPGSSMSTADSPFIYSGSPISGAGEVLISKSEVMVSASDAASVKAALQSAKMKDYTGADPNLVTINNGTLTGYVINYKFTTSGGEQSEVWQMGFYAPKSSSVVVLSLITPYFDSKTSDSFLTYAYQVFNSVKID